MDDIKRGEIYWIEDNRTFINEEGNCEQRGSRPGIIVSNDKNNSSSYNVEVIFLTTSIKKDLPTHTTIRSAIRTSTALCERITTVGKNRIREYISTCTKEEMEMIEQCIAISLGLNIETTPQQITTNQEIEIAEKDRCIMNLRIELEKAKKGEEIMKEMYQNLLKFTMDMDK